MELKAFFILLYLICSFVIFKQDFKERLISLWVIVLFFVVSITSVYFTQGMYVLLSNAILTLIYFSFCAVVLLLYYFVKEKKLINPLDGKIGLADIFMFLAIGITQDFITLILFFSVSFVISAICGLFLQKKHKTVPLAGILVVLFCAFKVFEFLN